MTGKIRRWVLAVGWVVLVLPGAWPSGAEEVQPRGPEGYRSWQNLYAKITTLKLPFIFLT